MTQDELSNMESKLKSVEEEMADLKAESSFNIVKKNVDHLVDDTDNMNCIKMRQLRKKVGTTYIERGLLIGK